MLLLGEKKCHSRERAFEGAEGPQNVNCIEFEKDRQHASLMRQVERSLVDGEDVDMQLLTPLKVGSGSRACGEGDSGSCLYDSREPAAEPSIDDISFGSTRAYALGNPDGSSWPRAPQSRRGNASPRTGPAGGLGSARKVVAGSGGSTVRLPALRCRAAGAG